MKVSVRWLRELCPVDWSVDEIARRLTLAGLEVEGREERRIGDGVVAARVLTKTPVQGSDHLNVCSVDDGAGTRQVVCGAANYVAGDVVPMARPGARLPNGMEIRSAKLRGVQSDGMLCSARELGLSDDHSGLMVLPRDTPVGVAMDDVLGLPDTVFELNVTPNRPDALSHLGVARELSALSGVPLRAVAVATVDAENVARAAAAVDVEDVQRCPRYVARVIEGVRTGPSPLHVQERLRACGVRPISNVVDATNLALLELGHPLHAFDLDRLEGGRIVVRRAREGEPITTLDGKERKLTADDLVIADAEKPVALAGVMGGATSEVSDATTRVLLESAMFEPSGVRRTSKRQGLHTEASHRFERGMDERGARAAADRCAQLIVELAGGTLLPGAIDVWPAPLPPARIRVRPERVSATLGAAVDAAEVARWLAALGFVRDGELWIAPSWRRDLTREIDCVEEIARLRGFDTIPIVVHKAGVGETAALRPAERVTQAARAALSAAGFDEALNYSFVAERDLAALGERPALRVANPLTVEQGAMRWTLLAGLLRNLHHNLARGARALRLYELGRTYAPSRDPVHGEGPLAWPDAERTRLSLIASGRLAKEWTAPERALDFFDAKGAVEGLAEAMGVPALRFEPVEVPFLHPASAAAVFIGDEPAGVVGELHPQVAAHFEVPPETFVAELDFPVFVHHARAVRPFRGVPKFPAVSRDLAFVVDAHVSAERLRDEIRAADEDKLLENVALFDLYRGAPVPEGKKSVAFGLTLRAGDRTLTDAEADALTGRIRERLRAAVGAEIRG